MTYNDLDLLVLKNILTSKKNGIDFANHGDAKIFSPETWNFANTVVNYIRTFHELPTLRILTEKLSKNSKQVESIKNIWSHLDKIQSDEKEYQHDLDRLKKRYAEKQLIAAKENLAKLDEGSIDISKTISDLQKSIKSIEDLNRNQAYDSKDIKDYLPHFVEKFKAKKANPKLDRGIMTGYRFLDYATNGLKPADFVLIAGESGFGKSLLLNNIAVQVWMQKNITTSLEYAEGKSIIYFSLEMPYEDCFNRLLSRLSGVSTRAIENADLTKEDFQKVQDSLNFINKFPHKFKIVDIADANANDLENIFVNEGDHYDAIFIDYLGIMKTNEKSEESDWLKQGTISYEIRAIARRHKLPIFSAVQLNRKSAGKDSSENIGLHRLARSGGIATHATHVLQIESRINEESHSSFIYHVIKNRKGPKGKGVLLKNLAAATLIDNSEAEDDTPSSDYDNYFPDQGDISKQMDDLELSL